MSGQVTNDIDALPLDVWKVLTEIDKWKERFPYIKEYKREDDDPTGTPLHVGTEYCCFEEDEIFLTPGKIVTLHGKIIHMDAIDETDDRCFDKGKKIIERITVDGEKNIFELTTIVETGYAGFNKYTKLSVKYNISYNEDDSKNMFTALRRTIIQPVLKQEVKMSLLVRCKAMKEYFNKKALADGVVENLPR